MKLSLIIEAIDKATAPLRKVTAATGGATRAMDKLGDQAQQATGPLARLSRLIQRTSVDTARLHAIGYRTGRTIGTLARVTAQGVTIGAGLAVTGLTAFISTVVRAGMTYDKGFSAKVNASTGKLKATMARFLLSVGRAGVFEFIVRQLQTLVAWTDRMAANGSLQRWARQVSDALVSVGRWLGGIDWVGVAKDIAAIGRAVFNVGRFLASVGGGGFSGLFNLAIVAVIGKMTFSLYGLGTALGIVSIAGAPLWAVVAVIGAIGAGAFLVYRNWDAIKGRLAAIWEGMKSAVAGAANAIVGFLQGMWGGIKTAFAAGVKLLWNTLPLWFRGILTGATFVVRTVAGAISGSPSATPAPAPSRRPVAPLVLGAPVQSQRNVRAGAGAAARGEISLHVTADPGVTIRPTKIVEPRNTAIEVVTGRAMAGAA
jgi:hypothetical protein